MNALRKAKWFTPEPLDASFERAYQTASIRSLPNARKPFCEGDHIADGTGLPVQQSE